MKKNLHLIGLLYDSIQKTSFLKRIVFLVTVVCCFFSSDIMAQGTIASLPVTDGSVNYYVYVGSIGSSNYLQQSTSSTYTDAQNAAVSTLPGTNGLAQWTVVTTGGSTVYLVNAYNGLRFALSSSTATSCITTLNTSNANIAITLAHTAGSATITATNGANTLNLVFVPIANSTTQRVIVISPEYPAGPGTSYMYDENAAEASTIPGNGTDCDAHRWLFASTTQAAASANPLYMWLETTTGSVITYRNLTTDRYFCFLDHGYDGNGGQYISSSGDNNRIQCMPAIFYTSNTGTAQNRAQDNQWISGSPTGYTCGIAGTAGFIRFQSNSLQYSINTGNRSAVTEFYSGNGNASYTNSTSPASFCSIWYQTAEAPVKPIVSVQTPGAITGTTATLNGSVDWAGGIAATVTARGFYYSTSSTFDPTISLAGATQITAGSGIGAFTGNATGLASGVTYYYYAYATNSTGTKYSAGISFIASSTIVATAGCVANGTGSSSASPALIVLAPTAPTIDGTVDASWSNAPANSIAKTISGAIQTGSTWQAMWDATNLYVLVKVKDANLNIAGTYNGDAVEIYLTTTEHQTRFNYGAPNTLPATNLSGTNQFTTGVTWAIPSATGGYTLEASIPWATIGMTPSNGASLRFDVNLDDNQTGTGRSAQAGWNSTDNQEFSTPSDFGYTVLTTCGNNPVIGTSVSTSAITSTTATFIDTIKATSGGALTANGSGTQYGTSSSLTGATILTYTGTPTIGTAFTTPVVAALTPQTKYYYQGYGTSNYGIGVSNILNFYTLSGAPSSQPASLTASPTTATGGCSQISLTWPASTFPASGLATQTGYIILRKAGAVAPLVTGIANRQPATGFTLPGGTTLLTTITTANGSLPGTNTYNDISVVNNTAYSYLVIPFTWDGTSLDSTYDYLLTGTLATATTTANTAIGWTGITDTTWNNTANWCNGVVPTATTDVTIPAGVTHYPSLIAGQAGLVHNLTVASGGKISIYGTAGNITSSGILSIYGTISAGTGTINASTGTIEMRGSSAQSITGASFINQTINNLIDSTTAGGLSIDSVSIIGELGFPYAGTSSLSISKDIVLISTSTNTAWVGPITEVSGVPQATITGKVIVQRYFPSHRRWRFITGAVTTASAQTINAAWQEGAVSVTGVSNPDPLPGYGTHITGPKNGAYQAGLGYDQSPTNNPSIAYVKDTSSWFTIPNTSITKVTDKQGYMLFVRGSRNYSIGVTNQYVTATNATLRTTGSIKTGIQNIPVVAGPNVIGNPYASTINFNTIFNKAVTKSALGSLTANNTFYLWDPNIASTANTATGTGGWVVLTSNGSGSYIPVPDPRSISPFDVNGDIQSGAAFIVHAQASGFVQIDETDKVSPAATNNDPYLFRPADVAPVTMLRTTLYATAADTISYLADGVLNMFDNSYSNEVDFNEDIQKQANLNEQCAITKSGHLMAVQRSLPVNAGDTIFLQLGHLNKITYRFSFEASAFNRPDLNAFLIDTFMHTSTPLSLGDNSTTVDFTVTTAPGSAAAQRFAIIFKPSPGSVIYNTVTATQQNKNVLVQWTVNNQLNIKEYIVERSANGTNFYPLDTTLATSGNTNYIVYNWIDANPITGTNYYRIRNIDNNAVFQESNIASVDIGKGILSGMAIYPNPVIDGSIGLQMNNMPIGEYGIKIMNSSGQVMLTETIYHGATSEIELIYLNKAAAPGVYILEAQLPNNTQTKIKFVNQ
jgi:hypothetical protein